MKITWTSKTIDKTEVGLLAIAYRQDSKNQAFEDIDKIAQKSLSELAKAEGFKGQKGRVLTWQGKVLSLPRIISVVGVGKDEDDPSAWKEAVGRAVGVATARRVKQMAFYIDSSKARQAIETRWTAEALGLSSYRFNSYKSKPPKTAPPQSAAIGIYPKPTAEKECKKALKVSKAVIEGVTLARDLTNEPANILSPKELANRAKSMAVKKGLECKVLEGKEIRKKKMNLLAAVSQGSSKDPRFIHLTYKPRGKAKAKIAFVGKGITFDSGGLCIKPGKSMYEMKTDMAGAGVVMGLMSAVKALGLRLEVHGIIPACENAINGDATRPGDVYKSFAGLTVEVLNTDAEGRLILADALAYGAQLKPDVIIDNATLTGACVVALGEKMAGIFTEDDELAEQYSSAGTKAGERMWRLPLTEEFDREIRSDVADVKNIGGRWGGASSAAAFLKKFVPKQRWIHVDIAGPARYSSATPICPKGGSGFGVLTALEYLMSL